LAVDPSLTCTGWALFGIKNKRLIAVGKVRSLPSSEPLSERILDLQGKINSIFESLSLGKNDILVCEAPTTMRDPGAAIKVEQVRGIFETVAREKQAIVPGRINPRSVQRELMGFGGQQQARALVKETAVRLVHTLYADDLTTLNFPTDLHRLSKHQDICDAILVGNLALVRVHSSLGADVPLSTVFEAPSPRYRRGLYK